MKVKSHRKRAEEKHYFILVFFIKINKIYEETFGLDSIRREKNFHFIILIIYSVHHAMLQIYRANFRAETKAKTKSQYLQTVHNSKQNKDIDVST